jgi:hypothetical protein
MRLDAVSWDAAGVSVCVEAGAGAVGASEAGFCAKPGAGSNDKIAKIAIPTRINFLSIIFPPGYEALFRYEK